MSLPKLTQNVADGGLGITPSSPANVVAFLGVCSVGAANTVRQFNGPNVKAVKDALGTGPLSEALAHVLEVSGGPHIAVPVTGSVAGAAGVVAHVGTGTSVMTVTGAAKDAYEVIVQITRAAASLVAAAAAFKYSLDGGDTFSPEIAVPASGSYALGATGCTLVFAEGTFVVNDEYSFNCTAPSFTTTDLQNAIAALLADPRKFGCLHVVGAPSPSKSAVTKTAAGPLITLTGTPLTFMYAKVKVTLEGALNVGKYKISLDDGATWGTEATLPLGGTFLIPDTGITLNFAAGTYALDEVYSFNTVASIAALFSLVDLALASAAEAYRYAFALLEAPDASDAILMKATANLSSTRVMFAAGYCELASSLAVVGGATYKRSDAWPIAARIAKSPIHEDLGRYMSGACPGVASLYRDENATPGLGAARFETLRTHTDAEGYFITSDTGGNMMAPLGSDYALVQNRRVMDRACTVNRVAMLRYLNDDLLVNSVTGFILEVEALGIEASVNGQLEADLVSGGSRHVSAVQCRVKRDENMLSTKNLTTSVSVTPKSYAKTITVDIGFKNPALSAA